MVSGDREPKSFFKIIFPSALEDKKLRIPTEFANEFRNDILSPATLLLPGEKRWPVKVFIKGGDLWFTDGLDKLFDFYSLSLAFFLVFKYCGNSEFKVRIFNPNTCEISYPSIDAKLSPQSEQVDLSRSRSEQGLNADRLIHVKKEVESNSNHDNVNSCYDDAEESRYNYGSGSDVEVIERKRSRVVDVFVLSSDDEDESVSIKKKARLNVEDDKKTNLRTPPPKNPWFRAKMKSYNIESDPLLNIPADIGRKYPSGMPGVVKLDVQDGRSFTVQGNFLKGRLTSLGQGWSEFVREMKLKVDDCCAFEVIINDEEFCLKFSRLRNRHSTRRTH